MFNNIYYLFEFESARNKNGSYQRSYFEKWKKVLNDYIRFCVYVIITLVQKITVIMQKVNVCNRNWPKKYYKLDCNFKIIRRDTCD